MDININKIDKIAGCKIEFFEAAIKKIVFIVVLVLLATGMTACSSPKKTISKTQKAEINHTTKFSSKTYGVAASPRVSTYKKVKRGGGYVSLGKPYKIKGRWYKPKDEPDYDKIGIASWYGPNFHGRLTANGEIYDQYALSAAHPTFPLPSYARVTNKENGRSVVVRVNDRGPYAHKRLIDLSSRTADVLDFKVQGTAKVRVQYLGRAPLHAQDVAYLEDSIRGVPRHSLPDLNSPQFPQVNTHDTIEPSVMVANSPVKNSNGSAFPNIRVNQNVPLAVINQQANSISEQQAPVSSNNGSVIRPSQRVENIFTGSIFKRKQPASKQASGKPFQLPGISNASDES